MGKKYIIKYEILLQNGTKISNKEIKINNCISEIEAQVKLEKYLIKKNPNFKQLIVHSCTEDILSAFDNMFGNIFDNNNIFNNFK